MKLFTNEEFARRYLAALKAVGDVSWEATLQHIEREVAGPRASGLASCARQQWYNITNAPQTNPSAASNNWSQLMGGAGQVLIAKVLREMGYTLADEEKTVALGECISGHIDGKLSGLDIGDEEVIWDSKLRNIYALYQWVTQPLVYADESAYMQMQAYLAAEELDVAIITVAPFDLSAARVETFIKRKVSVVEPLIHRIIIPADQEVQEVAEQRGKMLFAAAKMHIMPAREFDPLSAKDAKFPCGYCEWQALCVEAGQTNDFVLPRLTDEIKERVSNETI